VLKPQVLWAAAHHTDDERKALIQEWADRAVKLADEQPIEVGRYQ
jgi:hypothetical protein